jgi:hypothetical protein
LREIDIQKGLLTMQRILFTIVVIAVLLTSCSGINPVEPTPWPETVDWETAVEILHSGHVDSIVQLHSLSVTFLMDDGSQIKTVEPEIDLIFREVDQCGKPCEGITLATE